jgi:XTP/dITP diphosphohydrolase
MDRLRSPGGCPWDAEQTHESLRQYLVEETYELLDAIEDGDRSAQREELGDVLLQVLFHSRVAAEHATDPFTVDEVAAELVGKLVGRHPHVFAGGDPAVRDAASQAHRWEELKQAEKQRRSSVDGVAFGQPAVSLAAKLTSRAIRAGLPLDLLPGKGNDDGDTLFALAASIKLTGVDPEIELRTADRRFADDLRTAERNARDAGVDPLAMDADAWRRFWPR